MAGAEHDETRRAISRQRVDPVRHRAVAVEDDAFVVAGQLRVVAQRSEEDVLEVLFVATAPGVHQLRRLRGDLIEALEGVPQHQVLRLVIDAFEHRELGVEGLELDDGFLAERRAQKLLVDAVFRVETQLADRSEGDHQTDRPRLHDPDLLEVQSVLGAMAPQQVEGLVREKPLDGGRRWQKEVAEGRLHHLLGRHLRQVDFDHQLLGPLPGGAQRGLEVHAVLGADVHRAEQVEGSPTGRVGAPQERRRALPGERRDPGDLAALGCAGESCGDQENPRNAPADGPPLPAAPLRRAGRPTDLGGA